MTCQTCQSWAQDFLDGALDASKEAAVSGHLQSCPVCRQSVEAERARRAEWPLALGDAAARGLLPPDVLARFSRNMEALKRKRAGSDPGPGAP